MEKQAKQKNNILKLLPRAASAVFFQNQYPFSPRDHRNKRFSGPIVSIIPEQVRSHPKEEEEEEDAEPTSPKVSCFGQIKQKKEKIKKKKKRASGLPENTKKPLSKNEEVKLKKAPSTLRRLLRRSNSEDCNSISTVGSETVLVSDHKVPSLGQMKRFASGRREVFKSFDWKAQIAPVDFKGYYSDEEQGVENDQDDENEVIIPFSAPITVGSGCRSLDLKPRIEVNLWKRRTMNPPRPLHLDYH